MTELTLQELLQRRGRFITLMNDRFPRWDSAIIMENVNQYYFTGTIQDGILIIQRDGKFTYAVRRSLERALAESPLPEQEIVGISTYRDLAQAQGRNLGETYIEGDTMPTVTRERLSRYFTMSGAGFLDSLVRTVRSVKSPYEIAAIRESGEAHRKLLEERVPALLREGMTELEFIGEMTREMYSLGFQGIARFHQFQIDITIGQVGFGTNSLTPTWFDGPGGSLGNGPWAPFSGDPRRKLRRGEPVFVDCPFGLRGYHSDKTQVYFFGDEVPGKFLEAHRFCADIQKRLVQMIKPGEIPSKIYETIMASIPAGDMERFMGVNPGHRVKFLGHGVGLNIDDFPVIAGGFGDPLEENMVIALEPKCAVPGIGMAGVEDTYLVGQQGGECLTGGGWDIIVV
ncbi:MAG: Xaa-Pro peptidase family protein [Treponema sp.]|jgi:Xaa-Pro aminopeptidase|nr:Xaa-Pro peptidase family protein [Treponema sp.]